MSIILYPCCHSSIYLQWFPFRVSTHSSAPHHLLLLVLLLLWECVNSMKLRPNALMTIYSNWVSPTVCTPFNCPYNYIFVTCSVCSYLLILCNYAATQQSSLSQLRFVGFFLPSLPPLQIDFNGLHPFHSQSLFFWRDTHQVRVACQQF